jgi:hypothetical protein
VYIDGDIFGKGLSTPVDDDGGDDGGGVGVDGVGGDGSGGGGGVGTGGGGIGGSDGGVGGGSAELYRYNDYSWYVDDSGKACCPKHSGLVKV